MVQLRIGAAREDITPDWSLPLAGFAARTTPAVGVAHPLHVRVAVLESQAEDDARSRVVIVSGDLLWWGPQLVPTLRREIAAIADAPEANVLLSATHTHSGPQTATRASATVGVADERFLDLLRERTLAATRAAAADLAPVTVSRHGGTHALGFNRRLELSPAGAEDPALTVIRFSGADGTSRALLVHYTCHPVITEEPLVSGEYCGVAMDRLEARIGGTALFLQGCCGDINPDVAGTRETVRGTNADVERLGGALADAVETLLADEGEPLAPCPLRAAEHVVDLPFDALPHPDELAAGADEPGVLGEWRRALLAHPKWMVPAIPLRLQRLDLAEGLALLAMDGEIVSAYGLHIRARSGGTVLPMGYANGMTGYVPTARQIAEGGYEAGGAVPYFFLPAPFAPTVEDTLTGAIDRLVPTSHAV